MASVCGGCQRGYTPDNPRLVPRFIQCGHTFCTECLQRYRQGPTIVCPMCRTPTAVPNGVEQLTVARGILDSFRPSAPGMMSMQQSYMSAPPVGMASINPSQQQHQARQYSSLQPPSSTARPPAFNPAAAAANGNHEMYGVSPSYAAQGGLPYPVSSTGSGFMPPPPAHLAHFGPAFVNGDVDSPPPFVQSSPKSRPPPPIPSADFRVIEDKFRTLDEVRSGLRSAGLESSNLIIAIDYTKSNLWTGEKSFEGRSLHWTDPTGQVLNPYQRVCNVIARTLEQFDDDKQIPVFGFGDLTTKDTACFPFFPDGRMCDGFEEVLLRYNEITPHVVLSGPTNFAPVIREAIRICMGCSRPSYHILLIVADGQITSKMDTEAAIVEASRYPLSIICVGVGDGPWDDMVRFDNELPQRQFDNFQFVAFNEVQSKFPGQTFDAAFATEALMEIPEQYQKIRDLRML